jgi:hypothetical protein
MDFGVVPVGEEPPAVTGESLVPVVLERRKMAKKLRGPGAVDNYSERDYTGGAPIRGVCLSEWEQRAE